MLSSPGALASGATASTITSAVIANAPINPRLIVRAGAASSPPRNSGRLPQMYSSEVCALAFASAPAGAPCPKLDAGVEMLASVTAVEDAREHELPRRDRTEHDQRRRAPRDHHARHRDRDRERQQRLVPALAGDDLGQQLIDDLHGRVDRRTAGS